MLAKDSYRHYPIHASVSGLSPGRSSLSLRALYPAPSNYPCLRAVYALRSFPSSSYLVWVARVRERAFSPLCAAALCAAALYPRLPFFVLAILSLSRRALFCPPPKRTVSRARACLPARSRNERRALLSGPFFASSLFYPAFRCTVRSRNSRLIALSLQIYKKQNNQILLIRMKKLNRYVF